MPVAWKQIYLACSNYLEDVDGTISLNCSPPSTFMVALVDHHEYKVRPAFSHYSESFECYNQL